jgi:ankyrin repeat protein
MDTQQMIDEFFKTMDSHLFNPHYSSQEIQELKQLIDEILAKKHPINDKGKKFYTLLAHAASSRWDENSQIVSYLLSKGANVDAPSTRNETPLMGAVEHANPSVVSILIMHGANVNAKSTTGETPLSIINEAIERRREMGLDLKNEIEVKSILIKNGAV